MPQQRLKGTHFSEELLVIHHEARSHLQYRRTYLHISTPFLAEAPQSDALETAREEKCSWKKDLPISLAEQLQVMQIPCLKFDCYPDLPPLLRLQAAKGSQHKQPHSG